MAKRDRSNAELQTALKTQIGYLIRSCRDFDNGETSEYARIATTIRVLCHNTPSSNALLHQIGLDQRYFCAGSHSVEPSNMLSHSTLTTFLVKNSGRTYWQANLDSFPHRFVPFDAWWDAQVVLDQTRSIGLTRKTFVQHAANKEGGAHVDPKVDLAMEQLIEETIRYRSDSGETPTDVNRHIVRQIAHELLKSLRPNYHRQWKIQYGAFFFMPAIDKLGANQSSPPDPIPIEDYTQTPHNTPCPCLSGEQFDKCHASGAIRPIYGMQPAITQTVTAPPGAVSARMVMTVKPH